MPDASNITSNGVFVLPGTSLKGAVRNRALKIIRTLAREGTEKIIEKNINELLVLQVKKRQIQKLRAALK